MADDVTEPETTASEAEEAAEEKPAPKKKTSRAKKTAKANEYPTPEYEDAGEGMVRLGENLLSLRLPRHSQQIVTVTVGSAGARIPLETVEATVAANTEVMAEAEKRVEALRAARG